MARREGEEPTDVQDELELHHKPLLDCVAQIRGLLTEAVAPLSAGATSRRRDDQPYSLPIPEGWTVALRARGVPARVDGFRVRVSGIGLIDVPAGGASRKTARGFVGAQTRAALPELTSAVSAALGTLKHFVAGPRARAPGRRGPAGSRVTMDRCPRLAPSAMDRRLRAHS